MITFIAGLAFLALLIWGMNHFAKSDPARLAQLIRRFSAYGAFAGAGIMLLRGRFDLAIFLSLGGAWLMGWYRMRPRWPRMKTYIRGPVSRIRSAMIEMEIDHRTGKYRGTVLAGSFAGHSLDDLSLEKMLALFEDCIKADQEGAFLLENYLDRRFPRWRENMNTDKNTWSGIPRSSSGMMTEQEAFEVLGLAPRASSDEIKHAHRVLMKKLHPDQGGSTYLASRVNQAKDILLNRHR